MTRKKFTFIIVSICIILGFGGYLVYQKYIASKTNPDGTTNTSKDFSIFDSILPGSNDNNSDNNGNTTGGDQTSTVVSIRLHQTSYKPVAGYGLLTKNIERVVSDTAPGQKPKTVIEVVPIVRYADSSTGIIYEQDSTHAEERISNTTIPRAHEVLFSRDGVHVIYRFLNNDQQTILTFIGSLISNPTNNPREVTGNFIAQNIKSIALTPDTLSYVYLRPKPVGIDVVSNPFTIKKDRVLYSTPLAEWNIDTGTTSNTLTTKPSGVVVGYSYNIDNASSAYVKTISGLGLNQKTSTDSLYTLYSVVVNGNPRVFVLYNKTGQQAYDTGLETLSDKCTYSSGAFYCAVPRTIPTGTYPDDWYKGSVSFSDDLWKIDVKTQTLTHIENLNTISGIDAIKLQVTNDGKALYFIDKKTGLLWAYDL